MKKLGEPNNFYFCLQKRLKLSSGMPSRKLPSNYRSQPMWCMFDRYAMLAIPRSASEPLRLSNHSLTIRKLELESPESINQERHRSHWTATRIKFSRCTTWEDHTHSLGLKKTIWRRQLKLWTVIYFIITLLLFIYFLGVEGGSFKFKVLKLNVLCTIIVV